MKPNIIILTGGLSGSSVLAGLIAQKGYWLGNNTKEIRYQTYENSRLVDLNNQILNRSGYSWDDTIDIPPPSAESIKKIASMPDNNGYQDFILQCNENEPWLWKDPRLCYTIFFWKNILDLEKCKFILMSRDLRQAWTGLVLRGKMPIAFKDFETVEQNCILSSLAFFKQENLDFLQITFEGLILRPEQSIADINKFLGESLSLTEFKKIYRGTLYKKRWKTTDFYKAWMKFLYYKYLKRDIICFPRRREGQGSGWNHLK